MNENNENNRFVLQSSMNSITNSTTTNTTTNFTFKSQSQQQQQSQQSQQFSSSSSFSMENQNSSKDYKITASEVATACGISKYALPRSLWQAKINNWESNQENVFSLIFLLL